MILPEAVVRGHRIVEGLFEDAQRFGTPWALPGFHAGPAIKNASRGGLSQRPICSGQAIADWRRGRCLKGPRASRAILSPERDADEAGLSAWCSSA